MIGNIVTGREWPTRFSLEMLVHLLRFAEAEPSTPAHLRSQLRAIANHFSEYCQNTDSEIVRILKTESAENNTGAGDPVYTAFFCR